MNEIIKAMEERRSVRKFKADTVPKEMIEQIIEAGLYAASGMGKQAASVIAVTNKELRDRIAEDNRKIGGWGEGFDPFYGAPVILIVLGNKDTATHVYDGSLMMAGRRGLWTEAGENSFPRSSGFWPETERAFWRRS